MSLNTCSVPDRIHLTPQKTLYGANVIIFEGIMAFADKELLKVRKGLELLLGKPKCCSPRSAAQYRSTKSPE